MDKFPYGIDLPHVLLVLLVWLPIAFLAVTQRAIPDPLFDAGMVVLGYYFRAVSNASAGAGDRGLK